jgi:p-cumate 2,3-dioxygenase ferredoxin subunit
MHIDSVRQVRLPNGEMIALYRIADGYFATADLCTHGAACLSEGDIENDEIVCPFHGGTFDIKTGEATAAPCVIPVETYAVVVDGDIVYIEQ